MQNLDEILKETEFTQDERKVWEKVEYNNRARDLEFILNDLLESGEMTKEQAEAAKQNADVILERYAKWNYCDWLSVMRDAINYVMGWF